MIAPMTATKPIMIVITVKTPAPIIAVSPILSTIAGVMCPLLIAGSFIVLGSKSFIALS